LVWFKIMTSFQDEMQNLAKFTHFEKFIFIQQLLTQNMWSIGATICIFNNKLQKISLKFSFIWKSEKGLNMILSPFVKSSCWLLSTYLHPPWPWIHHMDVKCAFLNGDLDKDIYMSQPKDYKVVKPNNLICKLNNAIYGFKQTQRVWNMRIDGFLKSCGFWRCESNQNRSQFVWVSNFLYVF
jgi:hypothetical protein